VVSFAAAILADCSLLITARVAKQPVLSEIIVLRASVCSLVMSALVAVAVCLNV
jgi:hypothetical protein